MLRLCVSSPLATQAAVINGHNILTGKECMSFFYWHQRFSPLRVAPVKWRGQVHRLLVEAYQVAGTVINKLNLDYHKVRFLLGAYNN